MRKLLSLLLLVMLYGCTCLGQVPTQYVYVDTACQAVIPDYSDIVVVYDNCGDAILTQSPPQGTVIDGTTVVTMTAIDLYGNESSTSFDVVLLDTIPPTIQLNPEWSGYTDQEVYHMYRTFYGWVQYNFNEFNTQYGWDTINYDSVKIFHNTVVIPDTVRQDWWWGTGI